jgi:hypothetical protein
MQQGSIGDTIAMLRTAVGMLLEADRSCVADAALVADLVGLEGLRRQCDAVDVALLAELDQRGLAGSRCYANTVSLLADLLRISPAEAKGRMARASDLGPRCTQTGAPLDPIRPTTSAAQRDGVLSVEHVRVITHCLDRIPSSAGLGVVGEAERFLVEQASQLDARKFGAVANRHPGSASPRRAARSRPTTTALRHPARLRRVPATVVVQMTEQQLRNRAGMAFTDHDDPIPVAEALPLAAEADVVPAVLDQSGGVLAYGRSRRVASPGQRRALLARDGGCCFPGCTRPASWCQAHHVIAWDDGGPTDIDNMCLLCRYHHREFTKRGWTVHIRDGTPDWTPPT